MVRLMKWLDRKSNWVARFSVKNFLASIRSAQKSAQTFRWPCTPIIFVNQTIFRFQRNPTEQLVKGCYNHFHNILRLSDILSNFHFENTSVMEFSPSTPRLLDDLGDQWFCRLDIWRVQLKSKWTVGKKLLASDSNTIWEIRLIFENRIFFKFLVWKFTHFVRISFDGASGWCHDAHRDSDFQCEPIILSIRHFEGPTEQLVKERS